MTHEPFKKAMTPARIERIMKSSGAKTVSDFGRMLLGPEGSAPYPFARKLLTGERPPSRTTLALLVWIEAGFTPPWVDKSG